LARVWRINQPRIVHEEIDGEVIAIDLATGTYFSMPATAAVVWRTLDMGPVEAGNLIEVLLACFHDAPDHAADELDAFVADLVDHELVHETAEAPKVLPVLNGKRDAYVSPGVEKYTDMQELILLDPVHEVDAIGWPAPAKTSEA
jgi:hypothetical protein